MSLTLEQESILSLSEQLDELYAEKESLYLATGCSSTEEVIVMIKSMEAQLVELYSELDSNKS